MKKNEDFSNEFSNKLNSLINEYLFEKELTRFEIVNTLMQHVKLESCMQLNDYWTMLGILTDLLNDDLRKMFDDVEKERKEWEEMKPTKEE